MSLLMLGSLLKRFYGSGKSKTRTAIVRRFFPTEDGKAFEYKQAGSNHNFAIKSHPYRASHHGFKLTSPQMTKMVRRLNPNA